MKLNKTKKKMGKEEGSLEEWHSHVTYLRNLGNLVIENIKP